MSRLVLRSLVSDTITYGLSKAIPAAAMLASVVFFVRAVGEAEYGRYSLLVAIGAVVSSIAAGWINQGQLRYYSRYTAHAESYRAAIRWAQVGGTLIISAGTGIVVLLVLLKAMPALAISSVVAGGAFAVALMFHTVTVSTFQAQLQPQKVALLELVRALFYLAVPLTLLGIFGATHLALLVGVAASYLVGALFIRPGEDTTICGSVPAGAGERPVRGANIARALWVYGWPLSIWLACSMAFQVSDRFLIQHVFSYEQTGVYASAYDLIVRSFSLVFFPITLAVHPRIMKAWNEGDVRHSVALIRMALIGQIALFLPLAIGLVTLGPPVLEIMFGSEVASRQIGLLIPLSLAGLSWQIALIAHKPLELQERTRTMLGVILTVWLGNVLVIFTLLPHYGLPVVAYAFAGAGFVYGAACFGLGWRGMIRRKEVPVTSGAEVFPASRTPV